MTLEGAARDTADLQQRRERLLALAEHAEALRAENAALERQVCVVCTEGGQELPGCVGQAGCVPVPCGLLIGAEGEAASRCRAGASHLNALLPQSRTRTAPSCLVGAQAGEVEALRAENGRLQQLAMHASDLRTQNAQLSEVVADVPQLQVENACAPPPS